MKKALRTPKAPPKDSGAERIVADQVAAPPQSRVKPLRRWSVAELLAGAVNPPPAGAGAR